MSVGATGFTVAASGGVLPVIPKLPNGQYDYTSLTAKLLEIKSSPDNADETKANFNADATIAYDVVVATLDAMRQGEDGKILFPSGQPARVRRERRNGKFVTVLAGLDPKATDLKGLLG